MTHSIVAARCKDLIERSRITAALPARDHSKMGHIAVEWSEAIALLQEQAAVIEAQKKEFIALYSRAFEICTLGTRGPNGHDWLSELPRRENGPPFYQALRALAKYIAERIKIVQG